MSNINQMPVDVAALRSHTQSFMNFVHFVKHDFAFQPTKGHHLTCVNFSDIRERTDDFISSLIVTTCNWVFSRANQDRILAERNIQYQNPAMAGASLMQDVAKKFRRGEPQGQFGELLLFNFLQHFFGAVPLLRKMSLTTNPALERNGADAIHYMHENGANKLYLGESKCYESKYKFRDAFKASLDSIKTTFDSIDRELDLYLPDEFVDPQLLGIAKAYKANTLQNIHFELVCIIVYQEHKNFTFQSENQIKSDILKIVTSRCGGIQSADFASVTHLLPRLNYIVFPSWALSELLDKFSKMLGTT
ncbi:HamA C-terminal domain-containing protein [Chitinophaga rhizophila]|uniref:DUF1837 domain-containing protein n=1 Tax=Chitinophaga rhizophila TaxID=2866212 RepID=A0ABS7GA01_9BACT|nr:DUF1837 domain-containing protein [Chitinophaga rhizophila]MBW8683552.1 DUF1837 domain-containing protein [Chitinophaga rhizophila]